MRNTPLRTLSGFVAPLLRANVDTDAIFPSRVKFGVDEKDTSRFLFREWRFTPEGEERPEFVLNQPFRRESVFVIALDNFGCGSSREMAPWALRDFGIRCVIAPSFGTIFQSNCFRNGIAPVVLDRSEVERLGRDAEANPQYRLALDLDAMTVASPDGARFLFEMEAAQRRMLVEGLDTIGLTLTRRPEIEAFRRTDRVARPWAYL
jgi:3-isopropylmalate/(R)-2-methylmalate dehydratase small subunit